MHWKNHPAGFGLISKFLHWSVALLMLFLIALGWYMVRLDYYHPWYYNSFSLHQWLGLLVWLAGVVMLFWNGLVSRPFRRASDKKFEAYGAKVAHILLMATVLLTPVAGLVITLADGNALAIGTLQLPLTLQVSNSTRALAVDSHYYIAYATLVLVLVHASAAVKHQFIDKDNSLRRMLW